MTPDQLRSAVVSREACLTTLIPALKEATGKRTNSSLFAWLEDVTGIHRNAMHRWMAKEPHRRTPSRQSLASLRLVLAGLVGQPDHFMVGGRRLPRK